MKKFLALVLVTVICFSFWPGAAVTANAAFEPPFEVNAQAIYMVNLDTGVVLYEKNAHERRAPASLTKLMTTLLLFENVPDLANTRVTAPGYIYDELVLMPNSSTADIRPYEEVSCLDLAYAMMLPSANEAASIVADYIGNGNLDNFYSIMNARAAELGCTDTNFTSAHGYYGLDHNHYSSAYDMYLIAKACYETEGFMDIVTTNTYWMPITNKHPSVIVEGGPEGTSYPIHTTNRMQQPTQGVYDPRVHGIKTGSTEEAGRNFISTATYDGSTYLLVVMGAPWEPAEDGYSEAFHVAKAMYDWAFGNFSVSPALDTTHAAAEIPLEYCSDRDTLKVYPQTDFMTLMPNESDSSVIQQTINLPQAVAAPIKKGDVIGTVTLTMAGEEIGEVLLVSNEDVERSSFMYAMATVKKFLSSLYFKVVLILLLFIAAIYVLYLFLLARKRRKMKKINRRRKE